MSKIDDGGQAFPVPADDNAGWHSQEGMSLRDWFAGQTAASISGALTGAGRATAPKDAIMVAKASYTLADAMIAARKGGEA